MARRCLLLVVPVLVVAALTVPAGAAGAAPPLDAPVTVVAPGCRFASAEADANTGADGTVRGFASFSGGTCGQAGPIRYFEGAGDAWTAVRSPYRGRVLGTAWDGTASYLLYANTTGIHVTRRAGGVFTPGRTLSRRAFGPGTVAGGDVVALAGRWWAVWTEPVARSGRTSLYQALTIGQGHFHDGIARQRITFDGDTDVEPSLALEPGDTGDDGHAVLAWTRRDRHPAAGSHRRVRFARAAFDGRWTPLAVTPTGTSAADPDLAGGDGTVDAGYVVNGVVEHAASPPGFLAGTALGHGFNPRAGHVDGIRLLAWNTPVAASRVRLAMLDDGVVTALDVTGGVCRQQLVAVGGHDDRVTVLGVSFGTRRLWAVSGDAA